jgi:aromatic-L-amino-acid/L-tryptophan decarboxylase
MVSEGEGAMVPLGEMDLEEFRRGGHRIVDWIADYRTHPERYPVMSRCRPGEVRAQLPMAAPPEGESVERILNDFERVILPGITHWNHPAFFAYFGITGSGPGILGELLGSALNVNAMLWRTSPAATELEECVLDWLREMLGLPADFKGVIADCASTASLLAIAAARDAAAPEIRARGMAARAMPKLRLYTSKEAHSSIEKGAMILGIGQKNVRKIETDISFRMLPGALVQAVRTDIANGWRPFCVVATVGTTSTTSIDPVAEIAPICRDHGLWLHVDGAYGGMAAIVPEMRYVLDGCHEADSIVINPHKWLFTPLDCSALYVRDPEAFQRTFSLVPEYLKSREEGVTNYMDWGTWLGRRFRALKLWMVISYFGHEGLAARIRRHIELAQNLVQRIDADPDIERLAPAPFSTVCFRFRPQAQSHDAHQTQVGDDYLDRLNQAVLDAVNTSGEAFLSHTKINERYAIRLAIGNISSDQADVDRAWELLRYEASRLHDKMRRERFSAAGKS